MTWYCIVTNPNCQRRAEAGLAELGYRVFFPRVKRWVSHARTKTAKEYPLLGRYLFIEVHGDDFGAARSANGVEGFVAIAGKPVSIPSAWVERCIRRYIDGEWDFVRPMSLEDGEVRVNPPIPIGARVRLMEGEFEDQLAKVINRLRGGRLRVVPRGEYKPIIVREVSARAA